LKPYISNKGIYDKKEAGLYLFRNTYKRMKALKLRNGISWHSYSIFEQFGLLTFSTAREGGVSCGAWQSLNFGLHCGDNSDDVLENRRRLREIFELVPEQLVMAQQTHSKNVHIATFNDSGKGVTNQEDAISDTDAFVSREKKLCITIQTADCVPVFLYDPQNKVIGIAHAGWRGTVQNIAGETLKTMMQHFHTSPLDVVAAIGPSISAEAFEVGSEVIEAVHACFEENAPLLISTKNGKPHVDLWKANVLQLTLLGVKETNVEIAEICTYMDSRFFSARRDGLKSGRMLSGIMIL
jgi:polyphenol oxidase